jgi:two-component system cell cycle response regulator DivK
LGCADRVVTPDTARPLILVVDDSRANRMLIAELLKSRDYAVLEADSAERCVALMRERLPDLVLMDVQLPGIDGLTATRYLRADPMFAQVPVIALTSRNLARDKDAALAAGCDAYLTKPINQTECFQTIAAILGRHRGRPIPS